MNRKFDVYAIQALNYWVDPNLKFYKEINQKDRKSKLKGISGILAAYAVARSFKTLKNEKSRYEKLLQLVENRSKQLNKNQVVGTVEGLAEDILKVYGQRAISASSKILWFYRRSNVIIYDELARRTLERDTGFKLKKGDYATYYDKWIYLFEMNRKEIEKSCKNLYKVKSYSFANNLKDEKVIKITNSGWFHKRVFDYYLWLSGTNSIN